MPISRVFFYLPAADAKNSDEHVDVNTNFPVITGTKVDMDMDMNMGMGVDMDLDMDMDREMDRDIRHGHGYQKYTIVCMYGVY
jgi:hypothetical protein